MSTIPETDIIAIIFTDYRESKQAISGQPYTLDARTPENQTVLDKAKKLNRIGLRSKDALHISCAIFAECKYFLTTDDKILNKNNSIEEITVMDPIGFIKEVYL